MDNLNTINQDEGWINPYEPVYANEFNKDNLQDNITNEPKNKSKHKSQGKFLLLIIQIIICALLLVAVYIFKCFGGDLYSDFKAKYIEAYNDEIIIGDSFNDFSISEFLGNEADS